MSESENTLGILSHKMVPFDQNHASDNKENRQNPA